MRGIAALWILLLGNALSGPKLLFSVSGVANPSVTGPRERSGRTVGSDGIREGRVRGRGRCDSGIDTGDTGRRFEFDGWLEGWLDISGWANRREGPESSDVEKDATDRSKPFEDFSASFFSFVYRAY